MPRGAGQAPVAPRWKRILLKVEVPSAPDTESRTDAMNTRTLVEDLMGRKPEKRYDFIQKHARFARDLDI